jgi:hypothetical protein
MRGEVQTPLQELTLSPFLPTLHSSQIQGGFHLLDNKVLKPMIGHHHRYLGPYLDELAGIAEEHEIGNSFPGVPGGRPERANFGRTDCR